jgi:ABC-type sulfate/molybdate transport systems ATPase subunit/nucleotide-binding universal stress UspA family protein
MSIILTELTARFGRDIVVNRVSMEIKDRELFVLLGGSGSGKSTILRMIAGLTPPAGGRIELDGRDVTHLKPQARGVGFVFQNYSIFRHMTVAQNVAFGLRIRRVAAAERERRTAELLDLMGLGGLGGRFPDQLSGGQRQRVAVARALAYEPSVLLLDEPFSALDVKIRAQLRQNLRRIQRQLKVTTILVTHDQEEAFELADRIAVIERGHLVEVNTPEALYHEPRTEFAATFVGGGNVLVGRHTGEQIHLGDITLPLPPDAPRHEEDASIRLLFRPETISLSATPFPEDSGLHTLGQARIGDEIFTGSQRRVRLAMSQLSGARPLSPVPIYGQSVVHLEAAVSSDRHMDSPAVQPGDLVWVGLRHYHILDPTGLKILVGFSDGATGSAAAEWGWRMSEAAGGPITVLAVTAGEALSAARERVEELRRQWPGGLSPLMTTHVRQGNVATEILAEAREGQYEMVILGRGSEGLGPIARQILEETELPVLLVQEARPRIARILICTAAGEPGKSDIRFGGRLARQHRGSAVTVFHMHGPQQAAWERLRVEQHMEEAVGALQALNVEAQAKVKTLGEAGLVAEIAREADEGDYDLVVIGAPDARHPGKLRWTDFASGIVSATSRPVLVVPMLGR